MSRSLSSTGLWGGLTGRGWSRSVSSANAVIGNSGARHRLAQRTHSIGPIRLLREPLTGIFPGNFRLRTADVRPAPLRLAENHKHTSGQTSKRLTCDSDYSAVWRQEQSGEALTSYRVGSITSVCRGLSRRDRQRCSTAIWFAPVFLH